jgi:hypothetical protein
LIYSFEDTSIAKHQGFATCTKIKAISNPMTSPAWSPCNIVLNVESKRYLGRITFDTTTGGTPPGGSNLPDTYDIRQETGSHGYNNKDAFNGQVALAYNLAISENFLIGLEVAMQFGASTRFVSIAEIPGAGNDINEQIETSNTWSVALKPSYTISEKFMVYAKVSRANAKISGNIDLQVASIEGLLGDELSFNHSIIRSAVSVLA